MRGALTLFSIIGGLSCLSACHTSNLDPEAKTPRPSGLLGRWELISLQGGMAPGTPAVPREIVEFTSDSTVRFYLNGQLRQQYHFQPTTGSFCTQLNPVQLLRFSDGAEYGQTYAYQIQGSELVLDGNICVDGTINRYRWIQPQ